MSTLAARICDLTAPSFPDYYTEQEKSYLSKVLSDARYFALPYEGDFTADWLLSPFESMEWQTRNRGREEFVDGKWRNTVNVSWDVRLNGSNNLSSPEFHALLNLNKKIAFLVRSGFVGDYSAPQVWKGIVWVQFQLVRWMLLQEEQFVPRKFGFKLLDQASIQSLLSTFAVGGWTESLRYVQRILGELHLKIYRRPCPNLLANNPHSIPIEQAQYITQWLQENNFYAPILRGPNKGKLYLDRGKLAGLIGYSASTALSTSKFNLFCRQFEPDLQGDQLLTNVWQATEYPSQWTPTIRDAAAPGAPENTLTAVGVVLSVILATHRHLPDLVPNPTSISLSEALRVAATQCSASTHTMFVPVDIGLKYLNAAMQFVFVFGDAIVDYVLEVNTLAPIGRNTDEGEWNLEFACGELHEKFWVDVGGKKVTLSEVLKLSGFQPLASRSFIEFHASPTLLDMLDVLVGACIICMAILKPSRDDELKALNRDCLRYDGTGWFLHQHIGKTKLGDRHEEADKPIPQIAARAIQLLQRLGSGLSDAAGLTTKHSKRLFYLPSRTHVGPRQLTPGALNNMLDKFCDWVALPPSNDGRRWYIRIHEMRKWFLLLFFWSGRFDVLDAARFIAGHSDVKHIYAYIEREFPGEELPNLEATYAIERLRALDSTQLNSDKSEPGLSQLYYLVLKHFEADSLSLVPDYEWTDYVNSLRQQDRFHLEPHSIWNDDTSNPVGLIVSFVLRESGA